ncbi:hypothetical protein, partial [Fluviicola sp.]|uniref:hypothetical protein n=1 Tax=Fluviicola sp. TaxID=1917219 RepID=UPI0026052EEA
IDFGSGKSILVVFPFIDGEKYILEAVLARWKFKTIRLSSDGDLNRRTLESVKNKLNDLKDSKDSLHGICIEFPDEILFRDYFHIIEICNEKEPKVFISLSNHVYAIANFQGDDKTSLDSNELLGFE